MFRGVLYGPVEGRSIPTRLPVQPVGVWCEAACPHSGCVSELWVCGLVCSLGASTPCTVSKADGECRRPKLSFKAALLGAGSLLQLMCGTATLGNVTTC
jgi:hypothetical protein